MNLRGCGWTLVKQILLTVTRKCFNHKMWLLSMRRRKQLRKTKQQGNKTVEKQYMYVYSCTNKVFFSKIKNIHQITFMTDMHSSGQKSSCCICIAWHLNTEFSTNSTTMQQQCFHDVIMWMQHSNTWSLQK